MIRLFTHPSGLAGGVLVVLMLVTAAAAPLLAPFDPAAQDSDRLLPPGGRHLLGTDEFGRDILSRLLYGARVSLQVGIISVAIALLLGGSVGLISGYLLGIVDGLIERVVEVVLAFPTLILIIAIAGVVGPSLVTAMTAIGIAYAPSFARVVRGATLKVRAEEYVVAARALGAGPRRIIASHILPNVTAPIIVLATISFSTAILAEATLSFLGLGTQPPAPSWGSMLGSGRRYMELAPWVVISPGLAIMAAVFGFNLLGDALRDALDPRLRRG